MFLNKFSFLKPLFNTLSHKTNRAFVVFPDNREKKIWRDKRYYRRYVEDDLAFPYENIDLNGGPARLAEYVKRTPELTLFPLNMAFLCYNVAKVGLYEPMVFEEVERHIVKYKELFKSRHAFGCLYGFLRTNAGSTNAIAFLEEEILRVMPDITAQEAIELIIASSYNTQLSREHIHEFITTHLKPKVLEEWKDKVKYRPPTIIQLFDRMSVMEYYDKEIWTKLLEDMKGRKGIKKLDPMLFIRTRLLDMQKAKKIGINLQNDIQFWEDKITKHHDFSYRYNFAEQRYYTYEELKSRREDYKYVDQYDTHILPLTDGGEDEFAGMSEAEKAEYLNEKDKKEREEQFDELVMERMMMMKKGDLFSGIEGLEHDEEDEAAVAYDEEEDEDEDEDEEEEDETEADIKVATKKAQEQAIKEKMRQEKVIRKQMFKEGKAVESKATKEE